jgi:hypothetical protein
MKERPILFSAPMVRALLDGRKTQTRRIVKHRPTMIEVDGVTVHGKKQKCPYGQAGDRLWVRETWQLFPRIEGASRIYYRASCTAPSVLDDWRWTPSIHMPRWASRILLEVTAVRVERLQAISRADAAAEGICFPEGEPKPPGYRCDRWPEENFAGLWDSINGAGAWAANPWVWVVEFRRAS